MSANYLATFIISRTHTHYYPFFLLLNNNLEQQAQAIFKEWFIDNPENNEWSTGTFSELIKSTLNGDWGKEAPTGNNTEKVYCIRGADIPEVKAGNKGKMPTRYILPKNFATKQLTAGDIVVEISGGSPTQSTGRCTAITQSLLDRYDSGMVCTNFCKAMKPKEGYSLFIYYYWQLQLIVHGYCSSSVLTPFGRWL